MKVFVTNKIFYSKSIIINKRLRNKVLQNLNNILNAISEFD